MIFLTMSVTRMGRVLPFRSGSELLEELCLQVSRATERRQGRTEDRQRFVQYVIRRYGRLERYDSDDRALAFLESSLDGFVDSS